VRSAQVAGGDRDAVDAQPRLASRCCRALRAAVLIKDLDRTIDAILTRASDALVDPYADLLNRVRGSHADMLAALRHELIRHDYWSQAHVVTTERQITRAA
jgi:hypothetical protein